MKFSVPLLAVLGFLCIALPALAQTDSDGDGVEDGVDLCPDLDASFFDADGDGCPDPTQNARHVEYWFTGDLPLSYVIHANGAPNVTDGSDFTAIQQGFAAWSAVPGVTLASSYGGTTTQANADGMDGINQVTFEDPDFLAVYGSSVLAVGITTSFTEPSTFQGNPVRPGQIVDADMLFNPNRIFSTDTAAFGPDLRSVATHEAGHLFGISHSSVVTSTMFPALPAGTGARTLELDDQLVAFMSYPDAGTLAVANSISGTVTDGSSGLPIGGASVFAISVATGDTLGSQYALEDGSYQFTGLPDGDYFISVSPLQGDFTNGVVPALINEYVDGIATNTLWNPESWDLAESNADDDADRDPVVVSGGTVVTGIDIVTNVDLVGPALVEIAPDGAAEVRADAVFFVEFDEAIDFDSASSNVVLNRVVGGTPTPVGFALLQVTDENVLIVDPAGLMDYSTQYELVLQSGLTDRFGNALGTEVTTSFTVEPSPPLTIETVSPSIVSGGTVAVIYGEGFDLGAASANTVEFGGLSVVASTVNANAISVTVPLEIGAGPVDLSVSTSTATSNVLPITAVISNDIVKGTDIQTVGLDGDPFAVELLPDATYGYIATTAGVNWISSGFANADLGTTGQIPVPGGAVDLAVAPDGNRVYAVSREGRSLIVINSDYGSTSSPNPAFNTILDELEVAGEPVGIAVDPAGERAYVATLEGGVQVWDIELGSATFHRQVGLLVSPQPTLQGAIEVDRTGLRVLALDGSGEVLTWDASDPEAEPLLRTVGGSPRDIAIGPEGTVAYVSDETGSVAVLLLATNSISQVIATGGTPTAFTLTPSGQLGFVSDRLNDVLSGVDLAPGSPSFRTVTADVAVGSQPIDVAVAPSGDYLLVVEEGANEVRIVGIGQGPVIDYVHPRWVRPGDVITITGSGFAAMHPDLGITSSNAVYFEGVSTPVVPTHSSTTSMFVTVPADFAGGSVKVGFSGPVFVGLPDTFFSNPVSLRLLDSRRGDPGTDVFLSSSNGYDWDNAGVVATVAASPTGEFVIAVSLASRAYLVDSDPQSDGFGQILGSIALDTGCKPGRMVVAPDGRLAYYAGTDHEIHILDVDPSSPTYLSETGTVLNELQTPSRERANLMEITPSGELLVVSDELNDGLYFVDLRPESPAYHEAFAATGPLGFATGMAIHPSGLAVYFAASTGLVHVVDLDPVSDGYLQQVFTMPTEVAPRDIEFAPDGSRAYVPSRAYSPTGFTFLEYIDTSSLYAPFLDQVLTLQQDTAGAPTVGFLAPTGERMIVDLPGDGLTFFLGVASDLPTFEDLANPQINGTIDPVDVAWMPDGSGFWSASRADTGIRYVDLVDAFKLEPVSGQGQTGIAGEPLPAPLVFRVTDGTASPSAGAVAELEITSGGGYFGNGEPYRWLTADEDGLFSIDWTLGPEPDLGPPGNTFTLSLNDGFSVADGITAASQSDPGTLPLSQVQVLPVDGASNVSVTSTVRVSFSRAVDPVSVQPASLGLRRQSDGTAVEVAYGFADQNGSVSLTPLAGLSPSTTYEVFTTDGIVDTDGGALTNPSTTAFSTQAPPPLNLTAVSPPAATVGTQVVVSGTGFATAAGDNVVHFGAASAVATSVGTGFVTAYVPLGATTGDLTVEAGGQTSNARSFTVLVPETAPLDEIVSTVETGISVQSVAVTPDGSKAYTVSAETDEVLPVDLETFTNLDAIGVGSGPQGVVIHPDGSTAYVTNFGSGTVSVIDVSTDVVVTTIVVGANPVELVASPVGDRLYVVNRLDQTLSVIDIDASSASYHTVVASANTTKSTKGAAISPDGTVLYLGTSDGFLTIGLEISSFGVVSSYNTGKSTKGAAITPDGTLLLLVTTSNEVLVVDVSVGGSFGVVATAGTTKTTRGAAITPDGSLLYLLQEGSDEILVVELNISSSVSASVVLTPIVVTTEVVKTIEVDPDPGVIAFDPSGSGLAIVGHQRPDGQLTFLNVGSTPFGQLDASITLNPRTLNLGSRGRYVTGYVELPAGFFVENIDLSSILLNGLLAPEADRVEFVDRNQDTIREMVLKFDRQALQEILPVGDYVEITVQGTLDSGSRAWAGTDSIRTIRPQVIHPGAGDAFFPGQQILVSWLSPENVPVSAVDVHWSADNGESWEALAVQIPDVGSVEWTVPGQLTDLGMIEITLFDQRGDPLGIGISEDHFLIAERAVPVVMRSVELDVREGAGHLEWMVADPASVEGFHVYRSDREDGRYERVSGDVVGAVATPEGTKFVFEDASIFANRDYYYRLLEERPGGAGFEHGPYRLNWRLENALYQNRPNSFNPRTTIRFATAQDGRTRMVVYNLAGRVVDVILDEVLRADTHEVVWDGTDRSGRSVASGVYVYRLEAPGGFVASRKMTLLR